MVSPTNNLSALSPKIIERFKLVASHPETDELDYLSFIHMDPAKICDDINLRHSKDLHWFVTKTHTYTNPQVRVLALIIAEYFNPTKGYSYPPQSLLSALLGITRQTVSKLTKELEATGYWIITPGHADLSTRYTLAPVEFSRLRDFLVAERTPQKSYLDGATFPRVMINEGRSRQNLGSTARAPKAEAVPTEISADPTELTIVPDDTTTAPAASDTPTTSVVVTPESEIRQSVAAVDSVQDTAAATPPMAQPAKVTDDELSAVLRNIINDGFCLDENVAKGRVERALIKERLSNPLLSASELKGIATKKLADRIATGQWTDFNDDLLQKTITKMAASGPEEEDSLDLLSDQNEPNLPW